MSDWTTADEWFAEFIEELESSTRRRRRLWRERVVLPARVVMDRAFEAKTDQMRKVIAYERSKWLAEQRKAKA